MFKLILTIFLCTYSIFAYAFSVTATPSANTKVGVMYNQTNTPVGGTAPYSYSLYYGTLPPGTALNTSTGTVSGYPTKAGTYSYQIKVIDNLSAVGYAIVEDVVIAEGNINPAQNPSVIGLTTAQSLSTVLLTQNQIHNVTSHLQSLHDSFGSNALSSNEFHFSTSNFLDSNPEYAPIYQEISNNFRPYLHQLLNLNEFTVAGIPAALWGIGEVIKGGINVAGTTLRNNFLVGNFTGGMDLKLHEKLIGGMYYGYGKTTSNITQNNGDSTTIQNSGAIYLSMEPTHQTYIDALFGYGGLSSNESRWSASENSSLFNDPTASVYYGSIIAHYKIGNDSVSFNPFVEADFMDTFFNTSSEHVNNTDSLTYENSNYNPQFYSVGAEYKQNIFDKSNHSMTFISKLQYMYAYGSISNSTMFFTLIGSPSFTSASEAVPVNTGMLSAGIDYLTPQKLKISFTWQGSLGALDYSSNLFRIKIAQAL